MQVTTQKNETANAKILSICTKIRDGFSANLLDKNGKVLKEHEGYVPEFMPEQHFGDYIELKIDIETGQIVNWVQPTRAQLEAFIKE